MSHEWTMKFVEHRVADPRILRLIQKWLKAGVSEDGQWSETKVGTPQGAVVSPLLANVYLHYVFDLWVEAWRKKVAQGDVIVVRYADDLVVGFESRTEAERFLKEFRERLAKFGLELHPEKTRLIEFGRFAAQNREKRGEGKPETFTFLGFTHYCGKRRNDGAFIVARNGEEADGGEAACNQGRAEVRRRHEPKASVGAWLRKVTSGYYRYHAVPGNLPQFELFRHRLVGGVARYRAAASAAISPWTGSTGSSTDGFQSLAFSILILCSALTPVIRGGSRMRRSARTDLCGGRSAMIVPTATAKRISLRTSSAFRLTAVGRHVREVAIVAERASPGRCLQFDRAANRS